MGNLCVSYNKILGLLHELETQDNFLNRIRINKLSDKKLSALALAAESSGVDSERHMFKQLPTPLAGQIDRLVFNRRRRQLTFKIGYFRQRMVSILAPCQAYQHLPGDLQRSTQLRLLRGAQGVLFRLEDPCGVYAQRNDQDLRYFKCNDA